MSENVVYVPWLGEYDAAIGEAAFTDSDADGMADDWEQAIVDADPVDGILNIGGVLPGDDFDNDGWTNLQEFQAGTNPLDQQDVPQPTVFYIGFAGADDANVGSPTYPLSSLHKAIELINAQPDDNYVIHMASGIYSVPLEDDSPLTVDQNISIFGSGAVVDGMGSTKWNTGLAFSVGASKVLNKAFGLAQKVGA